MNAVEIKYLPVGNLFWRRSSKERWTVCGPGFVAPLAAAVAGMKVQDLDEIVLVDPSICPKCWEDMPWPSITKCTHCGNPPLAKTDEGLREIIGEWISAEPSTVHL
jgi:hypothetical protein